MTQSLYNTTYRTIFLLYIVCTVLPAVHPTAEKKYQSRKNEELDNSLAKEFVFCEKYYCWQVTEEENGRRKKWYVWGSTSGPSPREANAYNLFWQFCIDVCSKRFINITLLARSKMPKFPKFKMYLVSLNEPVHEISNNVVCATSKASDQPAHTHSLIRAFACRLNIL